MYARRYLKLLVNTTKVDTCYSISERLDEQVNLADLLLKKIQHFDASSLPKEIADDINSSFQLLKILGVFNINSFLSDIENHKH